MMGDFFKKSKEDIEAVKETNRHQSLIKARKIILKKAIERSKILIKENHNQLNMLNKEGQSKKQWQKI